MIPNNTHLKCLLLNIVNTAYDCGAWEHTDTAETYEVIFGRYEVAHQAMIDAIDELVPQQ